MSDTTKPWLTFARYRRRIKQMIWRAALGAAYALGLLAVSQGLPWIISLV